MTEQTAEATGTDAPAEGTGQQTKPTETVEFWREQAKKQEKRAKENAAAAKQLDEIKDAQKSETEKAAERIAKAEAEVASVPAKVADALREHLVALHEIDKDDAELFLTGNEPDLLLKQVTRLLARSAEQNAEQQKQGNRSPREGKNPPPSASGDERAFARQLFRKE